MRWRITTQSSAIQASDAWADGIQPIGQLFVRWLFTRKLQIRTVRIVVAARRLPAAEVAANTESKSRGNIVVAGTTTISPEVPTVGSAATRALEGERHGQACQTCMLLQGKTHADAIRLGL